MSELSPLAHPIAEGKTAKRILSVVTKARNEKRVSRGVKATHRSFRRGVNGVVILGGNTSPIDIISHFPAFCQSKNIPWVFIADSLDIGRAYGTKAPIVCLLVHEPQEGDQYAAFYTKLVRLVRKLDSKMEPLMEE